VEGQLLVGAIHELPLLIIALPLDALRLVEGRVRVRVNYYEINTFIHDENKLFKTFKEKNVPLQS
jgi:hypothetical protein